MCHVSGTVYSTDNTNPDAGKDWGQEQKGETSNEMAAWHHRLNGHEFEQTLGDSGGQRSLASTVNEVVKSWTWLSDLTKTIMLKILEHFLCNGSSIIFKLPSCDIHEALRMFPHSVQTDAQSGQSFLPEAGRISECWVSYIMNAWLSM